MALMSVKVPPSTICISARPGLTMSALFPFQAMLDDKAEELYDQPKMVLKAILRKHVLAGTPRSAQMLTSIEHKIQLR